MFVANKLIAVCILLTFSNILTVCGHDYKPKPIGKLIRGTFVNYDDQGDESARLYVCKAKQGKYYYTAIKTAPTSFPNHLIGNGVFSKSSIDLHANTITNDQCFYQQNGVAQEVTSCMFDARDLCDQQAISLSFMFNSQAIRLDFVKISAKHELLGNDEIAPYQCGIPWDGEEQPEFLDPVTFVSDPLPWIADGVGSNVITFVLRDEFTGYGCWAYALDDGSPADDQYGEFPNLYTYWKWHLFLAEVKNFNIPFECADASGIYIRVDQDTLLTGWQCADGQTGASYLLSMTDRLPICL